MQPHPHQRTPGERAHDHQQRDDAQEDPVPAPGGGDPRRNRRADEARQHPAERQDAHHPGPLGLAVCLRHDDHECQVECAAAEALERAETQQHPHVDRQATAEQSEGEDEDARRQRQDRPDAVDQSSGEHDREDLSDDESREGPGVQIQSAEILRGIGHGGQRPVGLERHRQGTTDHGDREDERWAAGGGGGRLSHQPIVARVRKRATLEA